MSTPRLIDRVARALSGQLGTERPWRVALVVLLCVISVLALSPTPPREADLGWDKLNHLAAFGALAVTASLGFGRAWARVGVSLLGYGALIEVVQAFIPNRSSDWDDLLADAVGIVLGLALAAGASRLFRRRA
jgi:VanZ family protein